MQFELKFSNKEVDTNVAQQATANTKCIIVACDDDDCHYEKFFADVALAEGVYHYRDNKTGGIVAFVLDHDISYEVFRAMYQYYFRVVRNCNFQIVVPSLIVKEDKSEACYYTMQRDFGAMLMSEKKHFSIDGFDFETHKLLVNDYIKN